MSENNIATFRTEFEFDKEYVPELLEGSGCTIIKESILEFDSPSMNLAVFTVQLPDDYTVNDLRQHMLKVMEETDNDSVSDLHRCEQTLRAGSEFGDPFEDVEEEAKVAQKKVPTPGFTGDDLPT